MGVNMTIHGQSARLAPMLVLVTGLAGCGGDGGGGADGFGEGGAPGLDSFASFAEATEAAAALDAAITAADPTAPEGFAGLGSVRYAGVLGFERAGADAPSVIGQLAVDVDFPSGGLTGRADEFITDTGSYVAGAVDLTDGVLTPADGSFAVAASGTVGDPDAATLVFATTAQGQFLGAGAELLEGSFAFDDGSSDWTGVFGAQAE